MKREIVKIFLAAIVVVFACSFSGCTKSEVRYNYVVRPMMWEKIDVTDDNGVTTTVDSLILVDEQEDIKAYLFFADTSQWEILSFADAKAGVLTKRDGSNDKKSYDVDMERNSDGFFQEGPLTNHNMLVALAYEFEDTGRPYGDNKIYGWKGAVAGEGVPKIEVAIKFNPWRDDKPYVESGWKIKNELPFVE